MCGTHRRRADKKNRQNCWNLACPDTSAPTHAAPEPPSLAIPLSSRCSTADLSTHLQPSRCCAMCIVPLIDTSVITSTRNHVCLVPRIKSETPDFIICDDQPAWESTRIRESPPEQMPVTKRNNAGEYSMLHLVE